MTNFVTPMQDGWITSFKGREWLQIEQWQYLFSTYFDHFICFSYRGVIREGDSVLVGPNEVGSFTNSQITSIHRYRSPCRLIKAGQAATVAIKGIERQAIRKVSSHFDTFEAMPHLIFAMPKYLLYWSSCVITTILEQRVHYLFWQLAKGTLKVQKELQ